MVKFHPNRSAAPQCDCDSLLSNIRQPFTQSILEVKLPEVTGPERRCVVPRHNDILIYSPNCPKFTLDAAHRARVNILAEINSFFFVFAIIMQSLGHKSITQVNYGF